MIQTGSSPDRVLSKYGRRHSSEPSVRSSLLCSASARRSPFARDPVRSSALVDGAIGLVAAPRGRFYRARFTIANGKITEVEVVVNPERLRQLHLAVLDDSLH